MKPKTAKQLKKTAVILASVGAINWGLGLLEFNLVSFLAEKLSMVPYIAEIVYGLVGLSGVYLLYSELNSK